ncbi:hypothetical protein HA075_23430 [bacterium BFN5]|nr:hypothetical protein HA075_23430 [bacterium BFN5]
MEKYTKIAAIDSVFEAQLLGDILTDRNIPHFMKSYYDSAYDGIFQGQKGWGAVFAPMESSSEIIEILHEIRGKTQN